MAGIGVEMFGAMAGASSQFIGQAAPAEAHELSWFQRWYVPIVSDFLRLKNLNAHAARDKRFAFESEPKLPVSAMTNLLVWRLSALRFTVVALIACLGLTLINEEMDPMNALNGTFVGGRGEDVDPRSAETCTGIATTAGRSAYDALVTAKGAAFEATAIAIGNATFNATYVSCVVSLESAGQALGDALAAISGPPPGVRRQLQPGGGGSGGSGKGGGGGGSSEGGGSSGGDGGGESGGNGGDGSGSAGSATGGPSLPALPIGGSQSATATDAPPSGDPPAGGEMAPAGGEMALGGGKKSLLEGKEAFFERLNTFRTGVSIISLVTRALALAALLASWCCAEQCGAARAAEPLLTEHNASGRTGPTRPTTERSASSLGSSLRSTSGVNVLGGSEQQQREQQLASRFGWSARLNIVALCLTLGGPYLSSGLPWYDLLGFQGLIESDELLLRDQTMYVVTARLTISVYLAGSTSTTLISLLPAACEAITVMKTVLPESSLWGFLLLALPPAAICVTFPTMASALQLVGDWWMMAYTWLICTSFVAHMVVAPYVNRHLEPDPSHAFTLLGRANLAKSALGALAYLFLGLWLWKIVEQVPDLTPAKNDAPPRPLQALSRVLIERSRAGARPHAGQGRPPRHRPLPVPLVLDTPRVLAQRPRHLLHRDARLARRVHVNGRAAAPARWRLRRLATCAL